MVDAPSNVSAQLVALQAQFEQYKHETNANQDAFFLCSMSLIIFFMQCGFAFLEAGAVRSKNTTNIIFKNVLDSLFAVICYWSVGWGLAYGPTGDNILSPFFGQGEFFLSGYDNYPKFFFQFVFAATAATIVAGAVAERCEITCYIVYCCVICTIVYPVLTHWGWADEGFLKRGFETGEGLRTTYLDFAGAGVVHVCGGIISLVAAKIMEPRIGRFNKNEGESLELKGHSVPFAALGGFILIFGFLAFNGGSTGTITTPGVGNIVALAMFNTIMSGAFASFVFLITFFMKHKKLTLLFTLNACLAGMVAACAGCDNSKPWTTIITGGGAGIIYLILSEFCVKIHVDDPLDAFAVHFGGGSWGLFSTAFLRNDGIIQALVSGDHVTHTFIQFGWQVVAWLSIIIWSTLIMAPIFLILKKLGKMRVPAEIEVKGLDIYKHGEAAYPLHAYGHGWDEFEPVKTHKTSVSVPEISLEQLAVAYENQTLPDVRKKSVYHNPTAYEHPEYHSQAKIKTITKKPNQVGPV